MVISALHRSLGLSLYQVCLLAASTHSLSHIRWTLLSPQLLTDIDSPASPPPWYIQMHRTYFLPKSPFLPSPPSPFHCLKLLSSGVSILRRAN